uniref:RIIa domain-containing protein n=1 Tax=Strigamia maritima TaxID=126957 RepID=T1ITI4_STRMM
MADRSDRSRITVPPGFRELLGALCREILRHQPKNIIEFSAQYFEQKLRERDGENRPLLRQTTSGDLIQSALDSGQITADVEDKAATMIQAAFRGHSAREQVKQIADDENKTSEPQKEFLTAICFPPRQKHELKTQAAPTPHFDEEPIIKIHHSEAKLILIDHDTARIVPILDPSSVSNSIDSALISAKLREFSSTIYVQSPLGAVAIRPSKTSRPFPLLQTTLVRTSSHPDTNNGQLLPPLPRLLLLHPDGGVSPLKIVDRDECTVIVAEDNPLVPPCTEFLVVPLSGPEVSNSEPESSAEHRHHSYLAAVPSPASLSQYISLRLQRHIGPTGSFHRRSLAALRSRTLALHPSLSFANPKAQTSGSSESSFLLRDSRSFALPPPPPNTPVPSLGQLDSTTLMALGESDEFVSATSITSFVVPPPPPNTPASSKKSSGTSSNVGDESQRTAANMSSMSGYLSDSRIEAEMLDMGASVGRDTLSAPDVTTMPPDAKFTKAGSSARTTISQQYNDK